MTNAPYLLLKARGGYRMGHGEMLDHMFYDGLASPFDGKPMGCFADATASQVTSSAVARRMISPLNRCGVRSRRCRPATFDKEIAPVSVKSRKGETVVSQDETPGTCDVSRSPRSSPHSARTAP